MSRRSAIGSGQSPDGQRPGGGAAASPPADEGHFAAGRGRPTRIGVGRRDGEYCAVAVEDIRVGDRLLEIDGLFVDRPDRYSVQVGKALHVRPPPDVSPDDDERYRWRYLNHSCRPNAAFRGRLLVAVVPIARGEEVTFDYNTTELELASPFECRCGHCGGQTIRGFRHLGPGDRRRREPLLAAHLRAMPGGADPGDADGRA